MIHFRRTTGTMYAIYANVILLSSIVVSIRGVKIIPPSFQEACSLFTVSTSTKNKNDVHSSIRPLLFKEEVKSVFHAGIRNGNKSLSCLNLHTKSTSPYVGSPLESLPKLSTFVSKSQVQVQDNTTTSNNKPNGNDRKEEADISPLNDLCTLLQAEPSDLLYLHTATTDHERGVYTFRPILKNENILRIPLSSCIRDDNPPSWYQTLESITPFSNDNDIGDGNYNHEEDEFNPHHYNPSQWATRLAASLLHFFLFNTTPTAADPTTSEQQVKLGQLQWLSMMPNPSSLRASLPIHWDERSISHAKCTALELAVDSSYFARADTISKLIASIEDSNLLHVLKDHDNNDDDDSYNTNLEHNLDYPKQNMNANIHKSPPSIHKNQLSQLCHDVLDLVQTRSCRVERLDGVQTIPSLRIIAPIFDFINHGSSRYCDEGSSNAYFGLEQEEVSSNTSSSSSRTTDGIIQYLVVRARRDIPAGDEILIDYGASSRPAWRCLASYGFVPEYRIASPNDVVSSANDDYDNDDGDDEQLEDESVAEVFMNGRRYEVGSHTIPFEMVEAATASFLEEEGINDDNNSMNHNGLENHINHNNSSNDDDDDDAIVFDQSLNPEVALRIAKRVSDAAFALLLETKEPIPTSNTIDNGEKQVTQQDANRIIASKLASSLRWSQHKVLLACALGLRDFAARDDDDTM